MERSRPEDDPELLRIQQQIDRLFRLIVGALLVCVLILLAMLW